MNGLPAELKERLTGVLSNRLGEIVQLRSVNGLSGGSINSALSVTLTSGRNYFLKYNFNDRHPGMFEAECKGLQLLKDTATVRIPEVIYHGVAGVYSFIIMQMIEPGKQRPDFYETLGRELSDLHRVTNGHFGHDHDNYIGSLPQKNDTCETFHEFFTEMRLLPLARMAHDNGSLPGDVFRDLEKLCPKLSTLIPEEPSALLHGDLWSGNRITGPEGSPWLIDPAVYYGHRETDIAMTRLFGGFDAPFYEAYNEQTPLYQGWEERLGLHNLYPLLVHLNLFGGGYLGQIRQILRQFR
jgi:fructosamine-3-kinase